MSSGGGGTVIGYKYSFGIHMGLSRGPVDELVEIKVGEKTAWRGSITANGNTTIDQPELFGGERGEGGIIGTLTTMFGGPTQTAPTELASVLASPMPGFRRRMTVFFNGIISMMNPYPKPWKFRVRRALQGWDGDPWYPEKAIISLVRPVSIAETAASFETRNVVDVESFNPPTPVPGGEFPAQYTMVITPGGPLVSINRVYWKIQSPDAGGGGEAGASPGDGSDGGGAGPGGAM